MVRELISPKKIQDRIDELARQIATDYHNQPLTLVGVLTGGFIFLADLSRALYQAGLHDLLIDFIKTSSYPEATASSRQPPKVTVDLSFNPAGKHVLIVEDIADTGHTLALVQHHLQVLDPASLKTVAFLNKPSKREVDIKLDYFGFEVEGWIEGYGLDSLRASPSILVRD